MYDKYFDEKQKDIFNSVSTQTKFNWLLKLQQLLRKSCCSIKQYISLCRLTDAKKYSMDNSTQDVSINLDPYAYPLKDFSKEIEIKQKEVIDLIEKIQRFCCQVNMKANKFKMNEFYFARTLFKQYDKLIKKQIQLTHAMQTRIKQAIKQKQNAHYINWSKRSMIFIFKKNELLQEILKIRHNGKVPNQFSNIAVLMNIEILASNYYKLKNRKTILETQIRRLQLARQIKLASQQSQFFKLKVARILKSNQKLSTLDFKRYISIINQDIINIQNQNTTLFHRKGRSLSAVFHRELQNKSDQFQSQDLVQDSFLSKQLQGDCFQ